MFCSKCGKENPDNATFCGECGLTFQAQPPQFQPQQFQQPQQQQFQQSSILYPTPTIAPLKKKRTGLTVFLSIIGTIVVLIVIGSLASKRDKPQSDNSGIVQSTNQQQREENVVTTLAPTALTVGNTVKLDNWEITLNSFSIENEIREEYWKYAPDEGNNYVICNLTVKNIGKKADTFLAYILTDSYAKILYEDYEFSRTNLITYDKDLSQSVINPLSCVTGVMVFSVTEDIANSGELKLNIHVGVKNAVFELK